MQNLTSIESLSYSILDPTGNITALVESCVDIDAQAETAQVIMMRHPEVEQVGFMGYSDIESHINNQSSVDPPVHASLRMAGGEFCGNASMSAAALCFVHRKKPLLNETTIRLQVSGASHPVEVKLINETEDGFYAGVHMPEAFAIDEAEFVFRDMKGRLPIVKMEGISHIIIGQESSFYGLLHAKEAAEEAVKTWCDMLSAEGLGLIFLAKGTTNVSMTPLVYVPGSGTVFWEHSCASGSAAVGMYYAKMTAQPVDLTLQEPGGDLRVECFPETGKTWLFGRVRLVTHYNLEG